jgi:hypothetical protein
MKVKIMQDNINQSSSSTQTPLILEYVTPKLEIHADFKQLTCGISAGLGLQDFPFNFEETL